MKLKYSFWTDGMDVPMGIGQPCSCTCASIFFTCTQITMVDFKTVFKERANNCLTTPFLKHLYFLQ